MQIVGILHVICALRYINHLVKAGMRCLGVPNTKHFHDITLIEDVLALYEKIKETLTSDQFVVEKHEEYEDSQGNVLDRRTYEDLARQGLL